MRRTYLEYHDRDRVGIDVFSELQETGGQIATNVLWLGTVLSSEIVFLNYAHGVTPVASGIDPNNCIIASMSVFAVSAIGCLFNIGKNGEFTFETIGRFIEQFKKAKKVIDYQDIEIKKSPYQIETELYSLLNSLTVIGFSDNFWLLRDYEDLLVDYKKYKSLIFKNNKKGDLLYAALTMEMEDLKRRIEEKEDTVCRIAKMKI